MEYESKNLTIDKIKNYENSVRFYFKEIGLVLFYKEHLHEKLISILEPGTSVLALIEKAPIPCILELRLTANNIIYIK